MGNANRKWTQQTNRQRRLKMRSAGTQRHMLHSSLLALLSVRTNAPIAGGSHHGIGPPVTVRQPNTIPTFRGAFPTFDIMSWVPPSGSFDPQSESWGGRGVPTHVVASGGGGGGQPPRRLRHCRHHCPSGTDVLIPRRPHCATPRSIATHIQLWQGRRRGQGGRSAADGGAARLYQPAPRACQL